MGISFSCSEQGLWCTSFSLQWLLLWSAGSRHTGFSSCSSRALDHRLGSWDARTHLIQGMRDPSRPGIKQVSPVSRGRVLTNGPPGKPHRVWTVGETFPIRFSMNGAQVRERHQPQLCTCVLSLLHTYHSTPAARCHMQSHQEPCFCSWSTGKEASVSLGLHSLSPWPSARLVGYPDCQVAHVSSYIYHS